MEVFVVFRPQRCLHLFLDIIKNILCLLIFSLLINRAKSIVANLTYAIFQF